MLAIGIGVPHSAVLFFCGSSNRQWPTPLYKMPTLGAFATEVNVQGCGKDAFLPAHPTESSNTCEGSIREDFCSHRVGAEPLLLHEIEYAPNSLSKCL